MSGTGLIPSNFNAEAGGSDTAREDRTDDQGFRQDPLLVQPANWTILIFRCSNISFLELVDWPSLKLRKPFLRG
jgi:hypothetical protein